MHIVNLKKIKKAILIQLKTNVFVALVVVVFSGVLVGGLFTKKPTGKVKGASIAIATTPSPTIEPTPTSSPVPKNTLISHPSDNSKVDNSNSADQPTDTPTGTPTPTDVPTPTPSDTPTPTPTDIPLPTDTPLASPTDTPIATPTSSPVDSISPTL